MTRFKALSVTALLFTAGILAGCTSSDRDHRSSRSSRSDEPVLSGERRGDVERASGAARKVPRDAEVVDEGRGDTLRYTARGDGTVYVVDSNADTVIWSGPIRDGDRITVDPGKNRIEINGREQANIDLKSGDRFRLYFLRGSSRYDTRH
jgi:hypothetical protein